MGLNHLQSLICTYSADDLRPLVIDSDPIIIKRRVKEAIHMRICLLQHKLDIGIDIPETWMLTTGNTKTG